MSISYTRTFAHNDWVDNVDRVQAGGDNGFNGRFHSVEAELDKISGVFGEVDTLLGTQSGQLTTLQQQVSALGTGIARTISVTPLLVATGPTGWDISTPGVARKPPSATSAHGAVTVTLPAGAQITAFRALGHNAGKGAILIDLTAQGLDGQNQAPVVRIQITAQMSPFDIALNPAVGHEAIDANTSYFILAQLDNAGPTDDVVLTGFQVLYKAR